MTATEIILAIFAFIRALPALDRWFQAASAQYWAWRFNRNQEDYYKARDRAVEEDDTEDLQNQIGKHLPLVLLMLLPLVSATGCETAQGKVKSLCTIDFVARVCWVSKKNNEGYTFEEMAKRQIDCRKKNSKNERISRDCWFGLDEEDLTRIYTKLNACDTNQNPR